MVYYWLIADFPRCRVEERSRKRRGKGEAEDSSRSKRAKSSNDKKDTRTSGQTEKSAFDPKSDKKRKVAALQEPQPAAEGVKASADVSGEEKHPKHLLLTSVKKEDLSKPVSKAGVGQKGLPPIGS